VCEREIPGDFTFDSYFTNAEILNHIHGKRDRFDRPRGYVGDLKFNRKVEWKGSVIRIDEVAAQIDPDLRKTFQRGRHQQWYFTVTLHIPGVNHKARVVLILLMDQLGQTRAKGWALRKLTTIGVTPDPSVVLASAASSKPSLVMSLFPEVFASTRRIRVARAALFDGIRQSTARCCPAARSAAATDPKKPDSLVVP